MRFCVIGAGNGGRAFAAYLSSKGYPVNLYNRSYTRIYDIKKKGGIKAKGKLKGFFPIDLITQNLNLAVKDVDIILIVTPASAHISIAKNIAHLLTNDQIILLNPGRTFGAVEFRSIIEKERGNLPVFIAETQTLLFTSRQLKKNEVQILTIKDSVDFSAFPEKHTFFISDTLRDVFPQMNPSDNYLQVTLNNMGMLLHPTLSLLNASAMDYGRKFNFYAQGASIHTCEILETLQMEFRKIFEKLNLKQINFCEWVEKSYGFKANSIYKAIQKIEAYKNIVAPKELITRYFTEDVPTGLVPMASLGEFLEISTPIIDSIINLSSILCGTDFKKEGRNIMNLKLANYITKQMKGEDLFGIKKSSEAQIST
ncbi:MAG: NADP transhydrogenase subunit alpha [Promethearchaeota archaeon Loki_b31]|nr:MAG: NADP transhydrogenase subunit alpha [Candidatus Lokiarchaeota archaeon Loki_b31]